MVLRDKSARLPFAVVGVFLLMASSITSVIIISLENQGAKRVSVSMSSEEIEKMIASLKNDLAICLNYAGMYAMNYVGNHPVTKPNNDSKNEGSKVAKDYNGGSWENYEDGWNIDEMIQFNINWSRNITRQRMNEYIEANYQNDYYNNGRYAINVKSIEKWRDIKVRKICMDLDSSVPTTIRNVFGDSRENFPVYLIFNLPLKIEIKDVENNKIVGERIVNISSLITSRLPLMMKLTQDFEEGINSGNLLDNKLFLLFTLLSEAYTEGRSLAQYGGMYEKIPNIVDNRWIRYLLNGALLFEEFMFFNSIDPVAAIYLLWNWKDLTATGFPEKEEIKDLFENSGSEEFENIFGRASDNLLKTIDKDENVQKKARSKIDNAISQVNLTNMAKSILYEVEYNYYYCSEDGELYMENNELPHSFKGYEIKSNGKTYALIHPPPYHYYNKTYYQIHNKNLSENSYHGKKWRYNGYLFNIVCDGDKSYEMKCGDLNKEVIREIKEKINETYDVDFLVHVSCNMEENFQPAPAPPSTSCTCGSWTVEKRAIGEHLEEGDVVKNFPYEEKWEVTQERQCSYEENNETVYFKQIRKYTFIFHVDASCVNDVKAPFEKVTIELSQMRHDDNLFYNSQNFVKEFVGKRDSILDNLDFASEEFTIKEEHSMDWIEEEVIFALEEIMDEMKNIKAAVNNIKNKDADEVIDEMVNQLIGKIEQNKSKYLDAGRYVENGKYKSCGARVVAKMREWYVDEVENAVNNARDEMKSKIDEELIKKFDNNKDIKIKVSDIKAAKDKTKGIDANNLPAIQFGLTMSLKNANLDWNEKIGFSIDHEPDYFKPPEQDDVYKFLEKNICIFGPTGLPILPTPITPWVITINAWYIHIEGQFSKFEVVDTVGEMRPSMLFGETDQAYVREGMDVYDISGAPLGVSEFVSFVLDTGNIAVTPPGFFGDINPTSYPEEKEGIPMEVVR